MYSLNDSESVLSAEDPQKALKAYSLSWKAQNIRSNKYYRAQTNDASDACRHYVWAQLLTESFGRDYAEKVLYAHENEATQAEEEKAMDIANNNRGISQAERRLKEKPLSADQILRDFEQDLASGKLIILKKDPAKEIKK